MVIAVVKLFMITVGPYESLQEAITLVYPSNYYENTKHHRLLLDAASVTGARVVK